MADIQVQPVVANASTALTAPPTALVNYAGSLGIDEDAFNNMYTQLKASNPQLGDAQIAMALKQYASQPQTQLQSGMAKEQAVNNALPNPDQIKANSNPQAAQDYADQLTSFQNQNQARQALSGNLASQSDLARQQAGGTPSAVNQNNAYWQQQQDLIKANTLDKAANASKLQAAQTSQLGDLRDQLQKGIDNVKSNTQTQIEFEGMDPTSAISRQAQQWAVANKLLTPEQAKSISAAQLNILLGTNGAYQKVLNDSMTARAGALKENTAARAQQANENLTGVSGAGAPQIPMGNGPTLGAPAGNTAAPPVVAKPAVAPTVNAPQAPSVPSAGPANTTSSTGATSNLNVRGVPMIPDGKGGITVDPTYTATHNKMAEDGVTRNALAQKQIQAAPMEMTLINRTIDDAKKAWTGVGANYAGQIPGSATAALQGDLDQLRLLRNQSFVQGGGSAGAERLEAIQEAIKNAIGNPAQGREPLMKALVLEKNQTMQSINDAKEVTRAFKEDPTLKTYNPTSFSPTEVYKDKAGGLHEVRKDPKTGKPTQLIGDL